MTPESACGWTGRVGYVYFRMTIARSPNCGAGGIEYGNRETNYEALKERIDEKKVVRLLKSKVKIEYCVKPYSRYCAWFF